MSRNPGHKSNEVLSSNQFKTISAIAHAEAGLVLIESKSSMISARVSKRLKALQVKSFDDYVKLLNSTEGRDEIPNLISTLTTNVSHFFRESHHFKTLEETVIPMIRKKAEIGEKIRIWSAGCSNGQEVYSIAMTMFEHFPEFDKFDVRILATDIDQEVIARAKKGSYQKKDLKGVSEKLVEKYFTSESETSHSANPRVKNAITFKHLNLLKSWPMKGKFDIIFCRNVVIYFDKETQDRLWQRFNDQLKVDGWLFIGHSERIHNTSEVGLKAAGITSYRKETQAPQASTSCNREEKKWH